MYGKVRHLLSAEDNNMPVPTGIVLHGLGPLMHSVKLHPALGSGGNEFRGSRNGGSTCRKMWVPSAGSSQKYAWDVLPTCRLNVFIPVCISILSGKHTRPDPCDLGSLWASVGVATIVMKCPILGHAVIECAHRTRSKMSQRCNLAIRNVFLCSVLSTLSSSKAELKFD